MGTITALVIANYRSFDSTLMLKNAAFEVASVIREVQVRSISSIRTSNNTATFNYPYGISFDKTSPTEYKLFRYRSALATEINYGDTSNVDNLGTEMFNKAIEIDEICVKLVNTAPVCDPDYERLDVSFRRPDYKAMFYIKRWTGAQPTSVEEATIKIHSTNGSPDVFLITINSYGQISVKKQ